MCDRTCGLWYNNTMITPRYEKNLHRLFILIVIVKAVSGVVDFCVGALLLFTGTVSSFFAALIRSELIEDPHDIIVLKATSFVAHLAPGTQLFAAVYFLAHAAVKLFLIFGLLGKKIWVYPTAIVLIFFLVLYEAYRFTNTHSLALLLLMFFDIMFAALVAHEYRHLRKKNFIAPDNS